MSDIVLLSLVGVKVVLGARRRPGDQRHPCPPWGKESRIRRRPARTPTPRPPDIVSVWSLAGKVNKRPSFPHAAKQAAEPLGLCGIDGGMTQPPKSYQPDADLGYVGEMRRRSDTTPILDCPGCRLYARHRHPSACRRPGPCVLTSTPIPPPPASPRSCGPKTSCS